MFDSGNTAYSSMDNTLFKALGLTMNDIRAIPGGGAISTAKKRSKLRVLGETKQLIPIQVSPYAPPMNIRLVLMPDLDMPLNISGRDLADHNVTMQLGKHFIYRGVKVPMISRAECGEEVSRCEAEVFIKNRVKLGPRQGTHVKAVIKEKDKFIVGHEAMISSVEAISETTKANPWHNAAIKIEPSKKEGEGICKVGLINTTNETIYIPAGTKYGKIEIMNSDNNIMSPFRIYSTDRKSDVKVPQHKILKKRRTEERRLCRISDSSKDDRLCNISVQDGGFQNVYSKGKDTPRRGHAAEDRRGQVAQETNKEFRPDNIQKEVAEVISKQECILKTNNEQVAQENNKSKFRQPDDLGKTVVSQEGNKELRNRRTSTGALRTSAAKTTKDKESSSPSSVGETDGCFVHKKDRERLKLPKDPDRQDDPMVGDQLELPAWMKGATDKNNMERRYHYLRDLFNIAENKNITPAQQDKFTAILMKNWQLFAWDGTYGSTHLVEHYIKTDTSKRPVNERHRAMNPMLDESLKKQIKKWLKHGVIEPSDSPWNSCLLAVVKASSSTDVRWTVDYRKLNAQTEIDRFPIGNIEDNLARLGKSTLFSALDNSGAFHVISIAKEDRPKTSFSTPYNCWQFTRLPFGLSGGPSSYARLVVQVLKGIPPEVAVAYVDDVLIHANGFDKHLQNLDRVMEAYTKAGLKLNPAKCTFLASKVHYLGHTVSQQGLEPQRDYVEIVSRWPLPVTRQQVIVFLGKLGYYRKFIRDYAKRAKPLTDVLKLTDVIKKMIADEEEKPTGRLQLVKKPVRRMSEAARTKEAMLKLSKTQRKKLMEEKFTPTKEFIAAFEDLRGTLLKAPILGHPRFDNLEDEPFILDTDWCKDTNTISGCLLQRQKVGEGKTREVALGYAAKKLSKSQANYSSGKGELCAIVTMMKHFRYHLWLGKFILRTDSSAARALKNSNDPTGMLARWRQRLAAFTFDAFHRAGVKHGNADGLSRIDFLSYNSEEDDDPFDEKTDKQYLFSMQEKRINCLVQKHLYFTPALVSPRERSQGIMVPKRDRFLCNIKTLEEARARRREKSSTITTLTEESTGVATDMAWTTEYSRQVQEEDDDISRVREWIEKGEKPTTEIRAEASEDLKALINIMDSLLFDKHGVLRYRKYSNHPEGGDVHSRDLVVLPRDILGDAIRKIHERIGHLGSENTLRAASRNVYGPGMRAKVEEVCRTCLTCQSKGGKPPKQDFHLKPSKQGYPFQSINCDIVGPLCRSRQGHEYLLTVECMFSRWVEAFPLSRPTALEVAVKLTREVFPRFGHPSIIKVDNGTHFKNHTINELAEMLGITVQFSPPYHPQSNPVERQHRTLKSILTAMLTEQSARRPAMWEEYLPAALFTLRTMVNRTTGYTPYQLVFGREASSELDIIFGTPPSRKEYPDKQSYVRAYGHAMRSAFRWANNNIESSIRRSRRYYYNHPARKFAVGDKVWLLTPIIRPGQRKSFLKPYTGPWTVKRVINEVTYELDPHSTWSRRTSQVAAVDRLKRYEAPEGEGDDGEVDSRNTHPPGMNEDLSIPGDDHLEEVTFVPEDDEDEGAELTAPEPFMRPLSPNVGHQVVQNPHLQQPVQQAPQVQHAQQPAQQVPQQGQQGQPPPEQPAQRPGEARPVEIQQQHQRENRVVPEEQPPAEIPRGQEEELRPQTPGDVADIPAQDGQEEVPVKRPRGRPRKNDPRNKEQRGQIRPREPIEPQRQQYPRAAKTKHQFIKPRDDQVKKVEEPDLTDQSMVLQARRRHAEAHDARRSSRQQLHRDSLRHEIERRQERLEDQERSRQEREPVSPPRTATRSKKFWKRR